jgi:hypothetical protein
VTLLNYHAEGSCHRREPKALGSSHPSLVAVPDFQVPRRAVGVHRRRQRPVLAAAGRRARPRRDAGTTSASPRTSAACGIAPRWKRPSQTRSEARPRALAEAPRGRRRARHAGEHGRPGR